MTPSDRGEIPKGAALDITPLTEASLPAVHALCEATVPEYSFPAEWFRRFTIGDMHYDPVLALVARVGDDDDPAGFIMATRRKRVAWFGWTAYLKFLVVRRDLQRQGVGTRLLDTLLERLKARKLRRVRVMDSNPDYIWPGLDPRFTAAYFFLKKHGFKKGRERVNLHVPLDEISPTRRPILGRTPPAEVAGYRLGRAGAGDKSSVVEFVHEHFRLGTWAEETALSFRNDPPTTFVARAPDTDAIVGFATHSSFFPGSFGPTGVEKSLRGHGLGGALLRWCLHDLATAGVPRMVIQWVVGDTIKFYSKTIGAKIGQVYWTMRRRV